MNISLHEIWAALQGYIVYIVGLFIAVFIDSISAVLSYLLYIPFSDMLDMKLMGDVGSEGAMGIQTAFVHVIDGQIYVFSLLGNELLQLVILFVTLIITIGKGIVDLRKQYKEWQDKKHPKIKRRRKTD